MPLCAAVKFGTQMDGSSEILEASVNGSDFSPHQGNVGEHGVIRAWLAASGGSGPSPPRRGDAGRESVSI